MKGRERELNVDGVVWGGGLDGVVLEDGLNRECALSVRILNSTGRLKVLRPDLSALLGDDRKANSIVVKADPCYLAKR